VTAPPAGLCRPVRLELLVIVATAAVLSFGGLGLLLADLGRYSPQLVLPLGLAGTAVFTVLARPRLVERTRPAGRASSTATLALCAVALGQFVWNAFDVTRHVAADRDPGVYLLTGKWLAQHRSLVVPVARIWSGSKGLFSVVSGGMYRMPNGTLQFQFAHLLSVLLAEADNLGGDGLMFRLPAVLGAIGLCTIYVVGCRIVRRPWLVVAAITCLALSLPELNVTRDSYSEPSTQVLLWGGVLLVCRAYELRSASVAFVAGLALGGTLMTHIDAVIYLAPLPLLAAVAWLTARNRRARRSLAPVIGFGLLGVVPPALLGTIDIQTRAGQYYDDLGGKMHALYALLGATTLLAAVVVGLSEAAPALYRRLTACAASNRRVASRVTSWIVGTGLLAAWALRPAKAVNGPKTPATAVVAQLQTSLGLPWQPDRTYAEQTLRWFEWYIGPIALVFAVVGLCILVHRAIGSGSVPAVILLTLIGGVVALYLWSPSNTPDQIWVTRRYVTGALPLFVLSAAVALDVGAAAITRYLANGTWARQFAAVGGASLIAFPLGTVAPVRNFHAEANWLSTVRHACTVLGPRAAVVFAGGDYDAVTLPMTFEDWCHVPTAVLPHPEPESTLVPVSDRLRTAGWTLWVLGSSPRAIATAVPGLSSRLIGTGVSTEELARTLEGPPENYTASTLTIYGSRIS
jgi:hypothetical protein